MTTTHTTYHGYEIIPILDDDMRTPIGWDVMAPGAHPDDEPIAELVADIDAAKAAVVEDLTWRKFQRTFGLLS